MVKVAVTSIELSPVEADLFKAVCKMQEVSWRAMNAQMVRGHLIRWKSRLVSDVEYCARKYGLSWEQAYMLAASDHKFNDAGVEWAKSLSQDQCWMTREMAETVNPANNTDSYKKEEK